MKPVLLYLSLCLLAYNVTQAQMTPAEIVADLTPGEGCSWPKHFLHFKDKLLFVAGADSSYDFWTTDGDTRPVRHKYPGIFVGWVTNSVPFVGSPVVANGDVYFANATFPTRKETDYQLYKWDGVNMPVLVKKINPNGSSAIRQLTLLDNKLYFSANDGIYDNELWVYDIATDKTKRLSTSFSQNDWLIYGIKAFNGKIYFTAMPTEAGIELFVYDPATDSISRLTETLIGTHGSGISNMEVFDNMLYFSSDIREHNAQLYAYDGSNPPVSVTPTGINVRPGRMAMAYLDGKIYLTANDTKNGIGIWVYDIATKAMKNIVSAADLGFSGIEYLFAYKNYIVFDGTYPRQQCNRQMMMYDARNKEIIKISSPFNNSYCLTSDEKTIFHGDLYFAAYENMLGEEVYKIRGTTEIKRPDNGISILLLPTYTTNSVTLRIRLLQAQRLSIVITDVAGRKLHSDYADYSAGNSNKTIDTDNFAQGMYHCVVYDANGRQAWVGKFVKM